MTISTRAADTRRHPSLRPEGRERGASSVEAALVLPIVVALLFAVVQGAVTLHAGTIAQASAQSAFEAARLYDGSASQAVAAGLAVAADAGSALTEVTVDVIVSATTITVTVRGQAASLVPGMPIGIERVVAGPRERWVG